MINIKIMNYNVLPRGFKIASFTSIKKSIIIIYDVPIYKNLNSNDVSL